MTNLHTMFCRKILMTKNTCYSVIFSYVVDTPKKKVLGCVQTDATTPNIVAPTILGVVACVLAVVC